MAIYEPLPSLSDADKRLILLMSRLLLEALDPPLHQSNRPTHSVTLTDREAQELLALLTTLLGSHEFNFACSFVEGISQKDFPNEALREQFLSARKRKGRTRALASIHWSQFLNRLGRSNSHIPYGHVEEMPLDHFFAMERRLFRATGINPKVSNFISEQLYAQSEELEEVRDGAKPLVRGSVKKDVGELVACGLKSIRHLSAARISAAIIIVANASVLFTTRDWSVTGTLSTMSGALAAASISD
jgi:hypothetical protein